VLVLIASQYVLQLDDLIGRPLPLIQIFYQIAECLAPDHIGGGRPQRIGLWFIFLGTGSTDCLGALLKLGYLVEFFGQVEPELMTTLLGEFVGF